LISCWLLVAEVADEPLTVITMLAEVAQVDLLKSFLLIFQQHKLIQSLLVVAVVLHPADMVFREPQEAIVP
jgi:hypothetical protein